MGTTKECMELKDILVKKSCWMSFLKPVHKKVLPVIIPSGVLGFVFYGTVRFFIENGFAESLQGKLFLTAVIFLYVWSVLLLFLVSCLVYTVAEAYQKKCNVMGRLKF